MGEIAELMLEGILCETCGEYFDDGKARGHPRRCMDCRDLERGREKKPPKRRQRPKL